jgi:hypothetical protein
MVDFSGTMLRRRTSRSKLKAVPTMSLRGAKHRGTPRMGVPIGEADIQDPSTQNRPVHLHRSVGLIGNYTIAAVMMAIL